MKSTRENEILKVSPESRLRGGRKQAKKAGRNSAFRKSGGRGTMARGELR